MPLCPAPMVPSHLFEGQCSCLRQKPKSATDPCPMPKKSAPKENLCSEICLHTAKKKYQKNKTQIAIGEQQTTYFVYTDPYGTKPLKPMYNNAAGLQDT